MGLGPPGTRRHSSDDGRLKSSRFDPSTESEVGNQSSLSDSTAERVRSGSGRGWLLRAFLIFSGSVAVALGIAGIFLPLLPTTPFLLLAASCYLRSSDRLYLWLVGNRWTGEYVQNYREGKGIPRRSKVFTVLLLWGTLACSAILVKATLARLLLVLVALIVPIFILRLPTRAP